MALPSISSVGQVLQQLAPFVSSTGTTATTAYQLNSQLVAANAALQAITGAVDPTFTNWQRNYTGQAQEADRVARFAVTQIGVVGTNATLTANVQSAFGVAPLGTPTALVIDTSTATFNALESRVTQALALCNQIGAVCVNTLEVPTGIATMISSANTLASATWAAKPATDPTGSTTYTTAVANLQTALNAAVSFINSASFA